ncbi:hypothetical protein [Psychromonas sp. SA13A]|uniref:AbiU2 domain-containing protein n=1 Tax=Psychromonas sp. SA13A TaxID=2686346 RepID=UPI001409BBE1|nr:hypothetical protein [Psychromonas sp. SA13A]
MSENNKIGRISTQEDFFKRMDLEMPNQPKIDRSKIDINEIGLFKNYFVALCTDLTIYKQLFSDVNSIQILNEFSPVIFGRLQSSYLERICLKIACLLDPATSGRDGVNKNMTLRRFTELCNSNELNSLVIELESFYESTGIKKWRNKVLAHTDLKAAMGQLDFELKFEVADLENIVIFIQEIIDLIEDPTTTSDTRVKLPNGNDVYTFLEKLNSI